ncbi:MAG TPA: RimK-like ATPgrasp N-terminal domain-containing protein [Candidatus Bathyarchaeia archaeon]|nr:RimK-like ATPgrasp N-terminal domain-containing protein [Candidatus Bathyarchaeia archaeon]
MLVVSNIDLTTDVTVMKPSTFLSSSISDSILNINNDYRYMKTGYYVSLHAETLEDPVIPSSVDIIDANRTPILLLRASKAGIPTIPYLVTDSIKQIISKFDFPVVIFPVNPFSCGDFKTAKNRSALYRAFKSLSLTYKYAVCAQPLLGEVISFKSIFGECDLDERTREISEKVYHAFRIPICKLYVQKVDGNAYLCGFHPLKIEEVLPHDVKAVSEEIFRVSKKGERHWLE